MAVTKAFSVLFPLLTIVLFHLCGSSNATRESCPATTSSPDEDPLPQTANKNTTRCGQVLTCTDGGIFYKPFERVLTNERCVWTIHASGATAYEITIPYYGYIRRADNSDDHGVIITQLEGRQKPRHFIPSNSTKMTLTNTSTVIVTFFSGPHANQSGFILEFKALYDANLGRASAPTSQHYLIGSEHYSQDYPNPRLYRIAELSTFIFAPKNNRFQEGKQSIISLNKMGLESGSDFMKVYGFNTTCVGVNKWEFKGRMWGTGPGNMERFHLIKTSEPVIVVYESVSGYYRTYPGFLFNYFTGAD